MTRSTAHRRAVPFLLAVIAMASAGVVLAVPAQAAVPPDDAVANATAIDLSGDTAAGDFFPNNVNATAEDSSADGALSGGEGAAQKTVWYSFQPAPGRVTVTVVSSDISHVVVGVVTSPSADAQLDGTTSEFDAINDGNVTNSDSADSSITRAVTAAANVPATFSFTADRQFVADAAHSYYLGVGSVGTDAGTTHLTVSYTKAPANDDFANAEPLTTTKGHYSGDTTAATPELDATLSNVDPVVGARPSMFSVWYRFAAPSSGSVVVDPTASAFPLAYEVCTSNLPSPADCAAHDVLDSTLVANPQQGFGFDAVKHQTYYLFLDGQPVDGQAYNASGAYAFRFHFTAAPANDDPSRPQVLPSRGIVRVKGTTVGATNTVLGANPPASVTTEASHGLVLKGHPLHTVWYSYTPRKSGPPMELYTSEGTLTTVEVFRGSLGTGFKDTKIGGRKYHGAGLARFPIAVQAKKTYVIGVGTAAGTLNSLASDFTFALGARPANDDLQHAKVIAKHAKASKPRGLVKGSTEFAGLQAHERLLQQHVGGADTWYAFVAPKAGRYRFTESLKRGYPVLSAYSGQGHDTLGLKRVKAGRGKNYNKPVTIKLGAKAGQRFELSVDGLTGYWGKYRLSWKKV